MKNIIKHLLASMLITAGLFANAPFEYNEVIFGPEDSMTDLEKPGVKIKLVSGKIKSGDKLLSLKFKQYPLYEDINSKKYTLIEENIYSLSNDNKIEQIDCQILSNSYFMCKGEMLNATMLNKTYVVAKKKAQRSGASQENKNEEFVGSNSGQSSDSSSNSSNWYEDNQQNNNEMNGKKDDSEGGENTEREGAEEDENKEDEDKEDGEEENNDNGEEDGEKPIDKDGNNPPKVNDIEKETGKNESIVIELPQKDEDGDIIIYSIINNPMHGTVKIEGNILTYTPQENYVGIDTIDYEGSDGELFSSTGTIKITVNGDSEEGTEDEVKDPKNNKPQIEDIKEEMNKNQILEVELPLKDIDGDEIKYTLLLLPKNGEAEIKGNIFIYKPYQDYFGQEELIYQANDGMLYSEKANMSIIVKEGELEEGSGNICNDETINEFMPMQSGNDIEGPMSDYMNGQRASEVNFNTPMDFMLNNPFFRNEITAISDTLQRCEEEGVLVTSLGLEIPDLNMLVADLTGGITQISDMLMDSVNNVTSPEMMASILIETAGYVTAAAVCVGKVIEDPELKQEILNKIGMCSLSESIPDVMGCSKVQGGTHSAKGVGETTSITPEPMKELGCAYEVTKELELTQKFSDCYQEEIKNASKRLFTELKQKINTRKYNPTKVLKQCQLDQKIQDKLDYSTYKGLGTIYAGYNKTGIENCLNEYQNPEKVKECLVRYYYVNNEGEEKIEQRASQTADAIMAERFEQISISARNLDEKLRLAHEIVKLEIMFSNAKVQNVFDEYYMYLSYYMKGGSKYQSNMDKYNNFCKDLMGLPEEIGENHICNPFKIIRRDNKIKSYTISPVSILSKTKRKYTYKEVGILEYVVDSYNSIVKQIVGGKLSKDELDGALSARIDGKRGEINPENNEVFNDQDIKEIYQRMYGAEHEEYMRNYNSVLGYQGQNVFTIENRSCEYIGFNLNVLGLAMGMINDIIKPYLETLKFSADPTMIEYDESAKIEKMMELTLDWTIFYPTCAYETGTSILTMQQIEQEYVACKEEFDGGSVDFGVEGGSDSGRHFPWFDIEGRAKVCTGSATQYVKLANCIANIEASFISKEIKECADTKRKEFMDLKFLNLDKYTKYDFVIKNENKRTCELKNRVSDTKLSIDVGIEGVQLAVSSEFKKQQVEFINNDLIFNELRNEYIKNELNDRNSGIFKNIIKPIGSFDFENEKPLTKLIDQEALLSAYDMVFKNWFYGVDVVYVEKNNQGDKFPYIKEIPDEEDTVADNFQDVSSNMYEYNLRGNIPSNLFVEMRSLPMDLELGPRIKAARLFCAKVSSRLDSSNANRLNSQNESDVEFVSWVNSLNENIYVNIFLKKETDTEIFMLPDFKQMPHGKEPLKQEDLALLKMGVDKFCTEVSDVSVKYGNIMNESAEIQANVETVREDFITKEVLKTKNEEIKEQIKTEQVVETPAQKEIKNIVNKNQGLVKKMQEEIDLIEEEL